MILSGHIVVITRERRTMNLAKTIVPIAAIVAMAASLLGATPVQAAVKLPAGCTSQDSPQSASEVYSLNCERLTSSADFSRYHVLQHLTIGPDESGQKSLVNTTSLPKLPASLFSLSINAPKMKNFSTLSIAKDLRWLTMNSGTSGLNLSSLSKWNPKLTWVALENTTATNLAPLGKLKQLETLSVSGSLPAHKATEGSWKPIIFPTGLNGKTILPRNEDFVDNKNRKNKLYAYDSKSKKIRYNNCSRGTDYIKQDPKKPATKMQPNIKFSSIFYTRSLNISCLSEWAEDTKNTLGFSGSPLIGKTVTAKLSRPKDNYIDKFQWYRAGKPIKGATNPSYKLGKADLGKKIALKATDTKDRISFVIEGAPKTVPYSVTKTVTNKAQYGFRTKKPTISGTSLPGKTLKAKTAKWGGSPSKYSYQWLRDGKAIKGATKSSYKVIKADQKRKISVKVTGSKKNYKTASATSTSTVVGKLTSSSKPKIKESIAGWTNTSMIYKLSSSKGGWNFPAKSFSYQWYKNGKAIKGANKSSVQAKLKTFDDKTKYTVKVKAKSAYGSASATSAAWKQW